MVHSSVHLLFVSVTGHENADLKFKKKHNNNQLLYIRVDMQNIGFAIHSGVTPRFVPILALFV